MTLNNIMVDIETIGSAPSGIIVSIAAVKFNFHNDDCEKFIVNCDVSSSKKLGMLMDASTIQWWATQPKSARDAWMVNPQPITKALTDFKEFVGYNWKDAVFWANGSQFDFSILNWSFNATEIEPPWKYWNIRDARTAYSIFGLNLREFPRVGEYHNALDDCMTQIAALKSVLC